METFYNVVVNHHFDEREEQYTHHCETKKEIGPVISWLLKQASTKIDDIHVYEIGEKEITNEVFTWFPKICVPSTRIEIKCMYATPSLLMAQDNQ